MSKVTDIDSMRPHFTVNLPNGDVHVMPVLLVQRVAKGELPLETLGDDVVRRIIGEWLYDRDC